MNLFLYQSYYSEEQLNKLNPVFIPYNNLNNPKPLLREYPMWKNLYEEHKGTDAYWGLLSWRWLEKTQLEPDVFRDWILDNQGYDVYHIDPFLDVAVTHTNIWTQGDIWVPGMIDFCNRLLPKLNVDKKIEDFVYHPEDFATCNYFVGNEKFWRSFITFIDHCLNIIEDDEEMKYYMYDKTIPYNGHQVPGFPFVNERLFSLHNILYRNITVKKFPVSYPNYRKIYGEAHDNLVELYNRKIEAYEKSY